MGKQWCLYKGATGGDGGSSTGKSSSAGKSRKRGGHTPSFSGCMSAFLHMFDIQHHHLPFHQPSFISQPSIQIPPPEPNIILKGVEAPRNSLELEEQEPTSSSSKPKQETSFNIPLREIQIKTKRSRLMEAAADTSSECSSSSPGTKTPSVVARLMGLDLLPDHNSSPRQSLSSPRVSSSSSHATPNLSKLSTRKHSVRASNSLPATPRMSTAPGRQSAEVDYHHRLSLQISKRRYDESIGSSSITTSEYAKQIAKQVRESISRRVGADITNTVRKDENRRDEYLVLLKPNRPSPPSSAASAVDKSRNLDNLRGKENETPLVSAALARLRLLDIKNNLNNQNNLNRPNSGSVKTSPLSLTTNSLPLKKCKKIANEKYGLKLKKMHQQQEEPYLKKCNSKKSTPLSNRLVKVNTTAKFISFKKDMASSSSSIPQKQVPLASITQLPSCQSRSYNTKDYTHKQPTQDAVNTNGNGDVIAAASATVSSISDHFDYISKILSHTGIEKTTVISISHWYSPSHPLHPSIFPQIENHFQSHHTATSTDTSPATSSGDRKLIFDVVDELLVGILKPYISLKPWAFGSSIARRMSGSELIGKLCEKVLSFPAADCQVLEDIDKLIDGDIGGLTRAVGTVAFEEEAEEVVAEMEREMVERLVDEVAEGIMWDVRCGGRV